MNIIVILLTIVLAILVIAGLLLFWLVISVSAKAKRVEKNIKKTYKNVDDASTFISAVSAGAAFVNGLVDGVHKHRAKKQRKSRTNR